MLGEAIGINLLLLAIGMGIGGLILVNNIEKARQSDSLLPQLLTMVVAMMFFGAGALLDYMFIVNIAQICVFIPVPWILYSDWWHKNKPPPESDFEPTVIAKDPLDLAKKIDDILDKSRRNRR